MAHSPVVDTICRDERWRNVSHIWAVERHRTRCSILRDDPFQKREVHNYFQCMTEYKDTMIVLYISTSILPLASLARYLLEKKAAVGAALQDPIIATLAIKPTQTTFVYKLNFQKAPHISVLSPAHGLLQSECLTSSTVPTTLSPQKQVLAFVVAKCWKA